MLTRWIALDKKVIAVSTERVDGWAAYIGAVPGVNHSIEWNDVLLGGNKLDEATARVIFGSDTHYASTVPYCP